MIQPMSLGVGIASSISASINIGVALKKVTHKYKEAPTSYASAIKQCRAVSGQLALLQTLMLNETWSKQLGSEGETSDYFVTIIMNCAENLQDLELLVGKIRLGILDIEGSAVEKLGLRQKLKLVWMDEDFKVLLSRLETSKDDFGRVLTILQSESLARVESQIDQLRTSMTELARSKSTKYRAIRLEGAGLDSQDNSIVVVPSTYAGAPQKVAGSGVSLADVDLTSVVLTISTEEEVSSIVNLATPINRTNLAQRAESIRTLIPNGMFSGQMKALVDFVEQDRNSIQQNLELSQEALRLETQRTTALQATVHDLTNDSLQRSRKFEQSMNMAAEQQRKVVAFAKTLSTERTRFKLMYESLEDEIKALHRNLFDTEAAPELSRDIDNKKLYEIEVRYVAMEQNQGRMKRRYDATIDAHAAFEAQTVEQIETYELELSDLRKTSQKYNSQLSQLAMKFKKDDERLREAEFRMVASRESRTSIAEAIEEMIKNNVNVNVNGTADLQP